MPPDVPLINDRLVIWVVAELHLLFAAFVLGAPIFIVICEYLGLRTGNQRYERLAKETMKIVAISYSLTALFGGAMSFVLVGRYQQLSNFIFQRFYAVFGMYAFILIVETGLIVLPDNICAVRENHDVASACGKVTERKPMAADMSR